MLNQVNKMRGEKEEKKKKPRTLYFRITKIPFFFFFNSYCFFVKLFTSLVEVRFQEREPEKRLGR